MTDLRHNVQMIFMLVVASVTTISAFCGCHSTPGSAERKLAEPAADAATAEAPDAAVPATPAALQRPVSLFGEFPDSENVPFEARPVHSLLQHTDCPEGADLDPTVDATGKFLAFASTRHARKPDIYMKGVGSAAVTQLTSDSASDIQPEFSPDGKRIVFASDRSGNFDIWMMTLNGSQATQLTREPAQDVHPTWAPDGQRIAYCSMNPRSGQWELWVLDLREPGARKFIGYGLYPRWSPTEDVIVYQRARERGQHLFSIWTLRLVNGEPRFPTEVSASATEAQILPTFSPDGRSIVFCAIGGPANSPQRAAPAESDLWMVNVDGSEPVRLTEGQGTNYSPFWAKDGRTYFTSTRGGRETIWSVRPVMDVTATRQAPAEPTLEHTAFSLESPGGVPAAGR